jgi:hypothetical protein
VARWKRCGVLVVRYAYDHPPNHVHVYEDNKQVLKFDIENWVTLEGSLTAKAKRALNQLKREGKI